MNWYLEALKKYAVFDGRARRKEYWFFVLFNFLIFLLGFIGVVFAGSDFISSLLGIYPLIVLLPSLAVSVRRLHDTGRSGWWLLLGLIPFFGLIVFFIMAEDSMLGENQYGPNPKYQEENSDVLLKSSKPEKKRRRGLF